MKKSLSLLIVVFALSQCNSDVSQSDFKLEKVQNLLIELDNYYLSEDSHNASLEKFNKIVSEIMQKHDTRISTISYSEHKELFQHSLTLARVSCVCCGEVTHTEIVDEGNGCFGIVRQYVNGSASISAYCNNGSTYEGYYCFAP